jgi:hypothetical protein
MAWLNAAGLINNAAQALAQTRAWRQRSSLSDADVDKVRQLIKDGRARATVVAECFGISRSHALAIAAGRARKPLIAGASVFNLAQA